MELSRRPFSLTYFNFVPNVSRKLLHDGQLAIALCFGHCIKLRLNYGMGCAKGRHFVA